MRLTEYVKMEERYHTSSFYCGSFTRLHMITLDLQSMDCNIFWGQAGFVDIKIEAQAGFFTTLSMKINYFGTRFLKRS